VPRRRSDVFVFVVPLGICRPLAATSVRFSIPARSVEEAAPNLNL